jgi:hypothetical protein
LIAPYADVSVAKPSNDLCPVRHPEGLLTVTGGSASGGEKLVRLRRLPPAPISTYCSFGSPATDVEHGRERGGVLQRLLVRLVRDGDLNGVGVEPFATISPTRNARPCNCTPAERLLCLVQCYAPAV